MPIQRAILNKPRWKLAGVEAERTGAVPANPEGRFRCHNCGDFISVYDRKCYACGKVGSS